MIKPEWFLIVFTIFEYQWFLRYCSMSFKSEWFVCGLLLLLRSLVDYLWPWLAILPSRSQFADLFLVLDRNLKFEVAKVLTSLKNKNRRSKSSIGNYLFSPALHNISHMQYLFPLELIRGHNRTSIEKSMGFAFSLLQLFKN